MKHERIGGFLISKIHQLSGRILARKLKENGIEEINPAQGRIMFVIWQNDGISINELAQKTSLGKSTMTSMLDRLENSGMIKRRRSLQDRRKILIIRTQKDKALQKKYDKISREMITLFYRGLREEDIDIFENYLEHIFRNLSK
jgi:DNA-binding MarR family transcriptional regulator